VALPDGGWCEPVRRLVQTHFAPFSASLHCGHLASRVQLHPNPNLNPLLPAMRLDPFPTRLAVVGFIDLVYLQVRHSGRRSVRTRDFGGFGVGDFAHGAVSRRPPILLYTTVARTGGYAYDVGVGDFVSIIQGPVSAAPCLTIRNFCIAVCGPPSIPHQAWDPSLRLDS
jgi:hypothetical protein